MIELKIGNVMWENISSDKLRKLYFDLQADAHGYETCFPKCHCCCSDTEPETFWLQFNAYHANLPQQLPRSTPIGWFACPAKKSYQAL